MNRGCFWHCLALIAIAGACRFGQCRHTRESQKTLAVPSVRKASAALNEYEEPVDEEVIMANNIVDEIRTRETLKIPEKKRERANQTEGKAPGCRVIKQGTLDVALNPLNVLKTKVFQTNITADGIVLAREKTPDKQVKRFSLPAIQMPVETLERSRDCFRLFYKAKPTVFCAPNYATRNEWIEAITEAVFCFNSGTAPSSAPQTEKGATLSLPSKSTKEQRWIAALQQAGVESTEDDNSEPDKNKTPEIEIADILEGKPTVTINGDEMPKKEVSEKEAGEMGASEF